MNVSKAMIQAFSSNVQDTVENLREFSLSGVSVIGGNHDVEAQG